MWYNKHGIKQSCWNEILPQPWFLADGLNYRICVGLNLCTKGYANIEYLKADNRKNDGKYVDEQLAQTICYQDYEL